MINFEKENEKYIVAIKVYENGQIRSISKEIFKNKFSNKLNKLSSSKLSLLVEKINIAIIKTTNIEKRFKLLGLIDVINEIQFSRYNKTQE